MYPNDVPNPAKVWDEDSEAFDKIMVLDDVDLA